MPGYDLVATHPENNTSARIQVKSRWRSGAPGFLISNFACNFVAVVRLNRGNKAGTGKVLPPEYFVFPVDVVEAARRDKGWRKVFLQQDSRLQSYRERWDLIVDFLETGSPNQRLQLTGDARDVLECRFTPLPRAAGN